MRWIKLSLVVVLLIGASPVRAGLFDRKAKTPAPQRVLELIRTLKNDPDADKRTKAAENLREFGADAFPEIVPALLEALHKDTDGDVRREAAQSLGRIRPTSADVDLALEQAADNDGSPRVRVQARLARVGYRVAEAPAPAQSNKGTPTKKANRLVPVPTTESRQPTTPKAKPMPKPPAGSDGPILAPPLPSPQNQTPESSDVKPASVPQQTVEEGPILLPPR